MSSLSQSTRSILAPSEAQVVTMIVCLSPAPVCLKKHLCNIPHLFTSRWNMAGTITFWVPHFHDDDFVVDPNYYFIAFAKTTSLTFVSGIGKQL